MQRSRQGRMQLLERTKRYNWDTGMKKSRYTGLLRYL